MKDKTKAILKTVAKDTIDYCSSDLKRLGLVILIGIILKIITDFYFGYALENPTKEVLIAAKILDIAIDSSIFGYGLLVTKDVIEGGSRLPEILIKKLFALGIKSYIIMTIFDFIQEYGMDLLEKALGIDDGALIYIVENLAYEPLVVIDSLSKFPLSIDILILLIGFAFGYMVIFFLEISLAILADSESLLSALNIKTIKETIDNIGWIYYTIDYTFIIISLAILFFVSEHAIYLGDIPGFIIGIIAELLIFIIEFRMIGLTYKNGKINPKTKHEANKTP